MFQIIYNIQECSCTIWQQCGLKKGGVHVDKMAMFPPFNKNIWVSISTLNLEGNKLMQAEQQEGTTRTCIKLVQTLMLSGQNVCISGSIFNKDIKTTSCLKGCGTAACVCVLKMPLIKAFLRWKWWQCSWIDLKLVKKDDICNVTHTQIFSRHVMRHMGGNLLNQCWCCAEEGDDAGYSMMVR